MSKRAALMLCLALVAFRPFWAGDAGAKDEIGEKVSQLVDLLRDSYAEEYTEARRIQRFEATGDQPALAVAVFTIEGFYGGNGHVQYLAVFALLKWPGGDRPARWTLIDVAPEGERGWRNLSEGITVKPSRGGILITVPTVEYTPKDPMCCPSKKSKATFFVKPDFGERIEETGK